MAELTVAVASRDRRHAESVLSRADALVNAESRAQVIESETQLL